jgi:hypothetical protein
MSLAVMTRRGILNLHLHLLSSTFRRWIDTSHPVNLMMCKRPLHRWNFPAIDDRLPCIIFLSLMVHQITEAIQVFFETDTGLILAGNSDVKLHKIATSPFPSHYVQQCCTFLCIPPLMVAHCRQTAAFSIRTFKLISFLIISHRNFTNRKSSIPRQFQEI